MRDGEPIAIMLAFVLGICVGLVLGWMFTVSSYRGQALKAKVAYYHSETGEFMFREKVEGKSKEEGKKK